MCCLKKILQGSIKANFNLYVTCYFETGHLKMKGNSRYTSLPELFPLD